MFENAYGLAINLVNGLKYQPLSRNAPTKPPLIENMAGRPKKDRVKEDWETCKLPNF